MKVIINKLLNVFVFVALTFSVNGQELNSHYLYEMNWLNVNPAYTGETDGIEAILNPGTQWIGIDGSPNNFMFGLHSKINDKMGLGGKIVTDKRGVFSNFTGELNYKYKATIAKGHFLNFGITAGIYRISLDINSFFGDNYTDGNDPVVTAQYYNETHFLSSFGILYQFKDLEVGLSSPHLVVSGKPVSDHLFLMARYSYAVEKLKIIPSIVYQNLLNSPNQLDAGLKLMWNSIFWGKFTFRTNNSFIAAVGVNIDKVQVKYAYTINSAAMRTISSGSQQVMIVYTFDKLGKGDKSKRKKRGASSAESSSRLAKTLSDLKSINKQNNITQEKQKEIAEIQAEITKLNNKGENGMNEKEYKKAMKDLEIRISKLKLQLK
jgi:type IX secretion system PorP/SprF family membrane protein